MSDRLAGWPAEVHAHDGDQRIGAPFRFGQPTWRPAETAEDYRRDHGPYVHPFRTCSYCGSIQPEDLHAYLIQWAPRAPLPSSAGLEETLAWARTPGLEMADWKYGWPHKFYVEGIPNPLAGRTVAVGSRSEDGVTTPIMGEAPATSRAKFYSVHLADCTGEALSAIADEIERHAGIRFDLLDGRLRWRRSAQVPA